MNNIRFIIDLIRFIFYVAFMIMCFLISEIYDRITSEE